MKTYIQKVVALMILIKLIPGCTGVRDLYRNSNGNFGEVILRRPFQFTLGGFPGVARVRIEGFKYFGENPFGDDINVHYNGLLSYGPNDMLFNIMQSCPSPLQGRWTASRDIMAIYWSNFVTGKVHSMPLEGENADQVLRDLNMTFNSERAQKFFVEREVDVVRRNVGKVKKGVVFTWNNMKNGFGTSQVKNHLFQTVLVETENLDDPEDSFWFLQSYYASLDGNGGNDRSDSLMGNACPQAQFGIGRRNSFTGIYTQPFSTFPSAAQYFTNEFDFADLASWVWDLSEGTVSQPSPPDSRCDGTINEDPRCKILREGENVSESNDENINPSATNNHYTKSSDSPGSPTPLRTMNPKFTKPAFNSLFLTKTSAMSIGQPDNSFCRYRDAGLYALPTACDVFVTCNIDGRVTLTQCPEGTRFNNLELLGCDHSHNVLCFNELFNPNGNVSTHGNICAYKPTGAYPDPNACNTYYLCSNSRSIQMSCPDNLLFKPTSENKGYCDFIKNVDCTAGGIRPSNSSTSTSPIPNLPETLPYHPRNVKIP